MWKYSRQFTALNSTESESNLRTPSAHKNIYQLTNLSLAMPRIIDISMKRQLMTGWGTEGRPKSAQCICTVSRSLPVLRCVDIWLSCSVWIVVTLQRAGYSVLLSLLPAWLDH